MSKLYWCDNEDDYVSDYDCSKCDKEDCDRKTKANERLKKLKDSKLIESVKNTLSATLHLEPDHLDKLLDELVQGIVHVSNSQIRTAIESAVEIRVAEYVGEKTDKVLDEYFNTALEGEAVLLMKDEAAVATKIREIILNRTKKYFMSKDNKRYDVDKSLETLIENRAQEKVDEAIIEIKAESIEKFNKEVMARLMRGMVKEIADDKRIIQLLET